jgi:hypothetical protein
MIQKRTIILIVLLIFVIAFSYFLNKSFIFQHSQLGYYTIDAGIIIDNYLEGKISLEAINSSKAGKDEGGIIYVNLWEDLEKDNVFDLEKRLEYLRKNYFDISVKEIKMRDELEKFKFSAPIGYYQLKKGLKKTIKFLKLQRKAHEFMLKFKINHKKNNTNAISSLAKEINLDDFFKYKIYFSYLICIKLFGSIYDNSIELSKKELEILEEIKKENYSLYNLFASINDYKIKNFAKVKEDLEIYKRKDIKNLFFNYIYIIMDDAISKVNQE